MHFHMKFEILTVMTFVEYTKIPDTHKSNNLTGELLRCIQDDRRRVREAYRSERKARRERETALKAELRNK